jgi:hypothetical protein
MIKPEFFESFTLSKISIEACYLFSGLWCYADDHGVHPDSIRMILGNVYRYRPEIKEKQVLEWLLELILRAEVLFRGEYAGKSFLIIKSWYEHQKVNRPSSRRYIPHKELLRFRESFNEGAPSSRSLTNEKEKEKGKGKRPGRSPSLKGTPGPQEEIRKQPRGVVEDIKRHREMEKKGKFVVDDKKAARSG